MVSKSIGEIGHALLHGLEQRHRLECLSALEDFLHNGETLGAPSLKSLRGKQSMFFALCFDSIDTLERIDKRTRRGISEFECLNEGSTCAHTASREQSSNLITPVRVGDPFVAPIRITLKHCFGVTKPA